MMEDFRSFTWDRREIVPQLIDHLWKLKIRLVATVSTGISIDNDNYSPFTSGNESDIFIKASKDTKRNMVGQAEPGEVAYPDFL